MIDENYSSFTKTGPGQATVIISPMSPKITAKREKRAREREREKKIKGARRAISLIRKYIRQSLI